MELSQKLAANPLKAHHVWMTHKTDKDPQGDPTVVQVPEPQVREMERAGYRLLSPAEQEVALEAPAPPPVEAKNAELPTAPVAAPVAAKPAANAGQVPLPPAKEAPAPPPAKGQAHAKGTAKPQAHEVDSDQQGDGHQVSRYKQ